MRYSFFFHLSHLLFSIPKSKKKKKRERENEKRKPAKARKTGD